MGCWSSRLSWLPLVYLLSLLRAKECLVQNLSVARSRCFGQAQGAPALFCLSSCRGCGSFPGWRFYLGHDVHQPPPGTILGDFISSLFKLIFLFSATHCGGENHTVTLSCMESESFVVLNLMISLGATSPCVRRNRERPFTVPWRGVMCL